VSFHAPNELRIRNGDFGTDDSIGNNGAFYYATGSRNDLKIIASDGGGWEHVSVSKRYETPTWEEMCKVKDLFWDEEDCVIQFHPPASQYVNNHKFCLHLWRCRDAVQPLPPLWMVGVK
jgi:hypothetical protein